MEQRVHLYCFQKSGMAAAQAGSTRTFAAADGIPRGKRGGAGRKELGGEGGNPQSVFVKIPKRPLTVLTERGGRTTELGDPGPSSVL